MDRPSRLLVLFFCTLTLASCGSKKKENSGPPRWTSLPVVIYADSAIVSNAATRNDFNEAMAFWESRAGKKLFDFRGAWGGQLPPFNGDPNRPDALFGNVIYFERSWPFSQNIAAQTIVFSQNSDLLSSVIMINSGAGLCAGNCVGNFGASERKVFAHELGHFLGLQHNSNTADVMYPEVQPGASLEGLQIDAAAFGQLTR